MTDIRITRAFALADLEVRSTVGDGRTLRLLAVPFDAPADVYEPAFGRFRETMRYGAFRAHDPRAGPGTREAAAPA